MEYMEHLEMTDIHKASYIELKNQINDIIKEEYPNILEINKEIINIAINEAPYLSKMLWVESI